MRVYVKKLPIILILFALFLAAAVLFIPTESFYAEGAEFSFTDGYAREIRATYDGTVKTITAEIIYDGEITYAWYKKSGEKFCDGNVLSVKYPKDSGVYYCKGESGANSAVTEDITVEIAKPVITVEIASVESEYGEMPVVLEYEAIGNFADGESAADLNITLKKEDGDNVGRYAITGSYDNENYEVKFRSATYIIRPKKIAGRLVGVNELVYDGKVPVIGCEILGEYALLGLETEISFDKAFPGAGEYTAFVRVKNKNYELENGGVFRFTVKKAPLKITLADTAYLNKGVPTFLYSGFAESESEKNLKTLPKVDLPEKVGEYEITPYGAESINYEITYASGKVTVYKGSLESEGAVFNGGFTPSATVTVTFDGETYGYKPFGITTDTVNIDFGGGNNGTYDGKIEGIKSSFPLFLAACIVDKEGERHSLTDFSVKDGVITFTADVEGCLIVYYDLVIPVSIAALIILVIGIIIIKIISDGRKYRKATALRRAAEKNVADAYRIVGRD